MLPIRCPRVLLLPLVAGLLTVVAVALSATTGGAQTPGPSLLPTPLPTPVPTPLGQQGGAAPVFIAPSGAIAGNHSICGRPLPGALGGDTITDPSGALTIFLSYQGNYSYGSPTTNVGEPALSVCHQQTNSTVVISLATGKELARTVRVSLGRSVLDSIVAGVRLTGDGYAPTIGSAPSTGGAASTGATVQTATGGQVVPGGPAAGSQGGTLLRPPNTGDGGLR